MCNFCLDLSTMCINSVIINFYKGIDEKLDELTSNSDYKST